LPDQPVLVTMQRAHNAMPEKGARVSLRHEVGDVVLVSK
jgi:2-aminoethylphosphonate transport system ATP-binding protein